VAEGSLPPIFFDVRASSDPASGGVLIGWLRACPTRNVLQRPCVGWSLDWLLRMHDRKPTVRGFWLMVRVHQLSKDRIRKSLHSNEFETTNLRPRSLAPAPATGSGVRFCDSKRLIVFDNPK
jgi:hypothetical protein